MPPSLELPVVGLLTDCFELVSDVYDRLLTGGVCVSLFFCLLCEYDYVCILYIKTCIYTYMPIYTYGRIHTEWVDFFLVILNILA